MVGSGGRVNIPSGSTKCWHRLKCDMYEFLSKRLFLRIVLVESVVVLHFVFIRILIFIPNLIKGAFMVCIELYGHVYIFYKNHIP
jgi:hypothetical protein